jgi:phytoene dehydrogenase-like protein
VDQSSTGHVGVVVVGAGLAGLAAAATAARSGTDVVVFDVRSAGGRARSTERDGFTLNQGPHALYRKGPGAAVLAGLGVRPAGGAPSTRVAGWRDGTFGILPTSAGSLVRSRLVGWRAKARLARLLTAIARIDAGSLAPLSAAGWVRSLGLPEDAAVVLLTLLRVATYSPDLEAMSADAAVRQLQLVQIGGVSYLHGGWTRIVDGLLDAALSAGARFVPGARVLEMRRDGADGAWEVRTSAGTWAARSVIVASGGPMAARTLLPSDPGWTPGPESTAACLDLGLRRIPDVPLAFGLDEPLYLSTHAPSAELAPAGMAMVHVLRYGARNSDADRAELWEFARRAGIQKDDVVVERFLHQMVVSHALPRPGEGLAGRPPVSVPDLPGLFVAGDWVGPIGLLADAALSSGEVAGRAAAALAGGVATASAGTA